MTKSDIVKRISKQSGLESEDVQVVVEAFMDSVRQALIGGKAVYLRGFGSFINKRRAAKVARNLKQNTALKVPAHHRPSFKPSRSFIELVKQAQHEKKAS